MKKLFILLFLLPFVQSTLGLDIELEPPQYTLPDQIYTFCGIQCDYLDLYADTTIYSSVGDEKMLDVILVSRNVSVEGTEKRNPVKNAALIIRMTDENSEEYYRIYTNEEGKAEFNFSFFYENDPDKSTDFKIMYCHSQEECSLDECFAMVGLNATDAGFETLGDVPLAEDTIVPTELQKPWLVLPTTTGTTYYPPPPRYLEIPVFCFPLIILFTFLAGAMFYTGRNPFGMFDFSTPRAPKAYRYTARARGITIDTMSVVMGVVKIAGAVKSAGGKKGKGKSGKEEKKGQQVVQTGGGQRVVAGGGTGLGRAVGITKALKGGAFKNLAKAFRDSKGAKPMPKARLRRMIGKQVVSAMGDTIGKAIPIVGVIIKAGGEDKWSDKLLVFGLGVLKTSSFGGLFYEIGNTIGDDHYLEKMFGYIDGSIEEAIGVIEKYSTSGVNVEHKGKTYNGRVVEKDGKLSLVFTVDGKTPAIVPNEVREEFGDNAINDLFVATRTINILGGREAYEQRMQNMKVLTAETDNAVDAAMGVIGEQKFNNFCNGQIVALNGSLGKSKSFEGSEKILEQLAMYHGALGGENAAIYGLLTSSDAVSAMSAAKLNTNFGKEFFESKNTLDQLNVIQVGLETRSNAYQQAAYLNSRLGDLINSGKTTMDANLENVFLGAVKGVGDIAAMDALSRELITQGRISIGDLPKKIEKDFNKSRNNLITTNAQASMIIAGIDVSTSLLQPPPDASDRQKADFVSMAQAIDSMINLPTILEPKPGSQEVSKKEIKKAIEGMFMTRKNISMESRVFSMVCLKELASAVNDPKRFDQVRREIQWFSSKSASEQADIAYPYVGRDTASNFRMGVAVDKYLMSMGASDVVKFGKKFSKVKEVRAVLPTYKNSIKTELKTRANLEARLSQLEYGDSYTRKQRMKYENMSNEELLTESRKILTAGEYAKTDLPKVRSLVATYKEALRTKSACAHTIMKNVPVGALAGATKANLFTKDEEKFLRKVGTSYVRDTVKILSPVAGMDEHLSTVHKELPFRTSGMPEYMSARLRDEAKKSKGLGGWSESDIVRYSHYMTTDRNKPYSKESIEERYHITGGTDYSGVARAYKKNKSGTRIPQ